MEHAVLNVVRLNELLACYLLRVDAYQGSIAPSLGKVESGSGAVATVTSFPGVTLESGSQLILNSTAAAPTTAQTNSAKAEYTNNKNTTQKKNDVEGDTSIKRNSIRVAG